MSTSPHLSRVISLTVKAPETRLLGGPEMFLDTSSGLVNLTCVIETLEPPRSVAWYHNNTKVSSTHTSRSNQSEQSLDCPRPMRVDQPETQTETASID